VEIPSSVAPQIFKYRSPNHGLAGIFREKRHPTQFSVATDFSDILPGSRPENERETFGYRSGIKFELVVAWDLNIILAHAT